MKIVIENRSKLPDTVAIMYVVDVMRNEMDFINKCRDVGCRLEDSRISVSVFPLSIDYPEDVLAFLVKDVGKKKTRKAGLKLR